MGNKMCVIRRRAVAERFTRPRRMLRQPSDVDYKKLRKLILSQKLAPCFDALDDPQIAGDLEECPICFLYYPSLNRSRCCAKGICTECFLQMKPLHTARPAQCPFCKASCYAVEYRGARTEEEKGLEQAEEQLVIEAKIKMQSESQIEDRVMPENPHQTRIMEGPSIEQSPLGRDSTQLEGSGVHGGANVYGTSVPNVCRRRPDEHDVDLEEIMVMEAIWQSLQDSREQVSGSSEIYSQSHNLSESNFSNIGLAEGTGVDTARFTEQKLTKQKVSEPDCERKPINQRTPCENSIHEFSTIRCEAGCSSGSHLNIVEQSCKLATET